MLTRTAGRRRHGLLVGLLVLALQGCNFLDNLISVEAPDRIQAEQLEQPGNALTLLAGAIADFECAYSQVIVFGSTFTDELQWSLGVESWRPIDARELTEGGFNSPQSYSTCDALFQGDTPGMYKVMSIARWQADHLLGLLDQWTDQNVAQREMIEARAAAYSGYSHILLGEMMCTAAFDLGPELEPQAIFERAVERFTRAITVAQTIPNDTIVNLARVGRARAKQNLGDLPGAKADAALVPEGFLVEAEYSSVSLRRENQVYAMNNRRNLASVEAPFRTVNDPRVPVLDDQRLSGRGIPMFVQQKYPTPDSPIPLATWEEAQLIVAEAELAAGNLPAAVQAINQVRRRPGVNLPAFSSNSAADIRTQLLYERKAEFFLESHRMGDLRRYNLPLTPAAGSPYPIGGSYGDQRCAPLPLDEKVNNPNI